MRDTASGLLDEAALAEELDTICSVTSANAEGALEIQALRRRHAGRMTSIDLHMVVLESITADDAHDICDRV
ncbi:cation transporter dimerization domain-containing protein [Aureimonas psammosilenae]|uniref:cation transporter dimerization domain-containing protein n=1 Tax=Aureimonas psammosilenae TaxID=2495496 RepID=UPI0022A6FA6B|nr:cation transporter dimerization domain-containing protein [Aureimonas psammosilenae]